MRFNIQHVFGGKCLAFLGVLMLMGGIFSPAYAGLSMEGNTYAVPGDSVGTEVVNGKTFILYRVEPKETLYSISNSYNVSVEELVQHNPETEAGLKEGAILRIPYRPEAVEAGAYHLVEKSETLYSIARQYGISVADLKAWNNLPTDAISLGDKLRVEGPSQTAGSRRTWANTAAGISTGDPLSYAGKIVHTVEPKETLYSVARMFDTTEENIKEWNRLPSDRLSIGQKLIVGTSQGLPGRSESGRLVRSEEEERPKDYKYNSNPISITQIGDPSQEDLEEGKPENGSVRKITELGLAMVIEDTVNTKKYLALHRTAPIGTIMQVHNEMNNLSVFVRVVGKLPATGDNDKVLIKLSQKAFEKLSAYNDKFPVRLTYVP